jgi:hypothetical protein
LLIDNSNTELSINFEHIEQFAFIPQTKSLKLIYYMPNFNFFGELESKMKRKIDEFQCAESALLLKAFHSIKNKLVLSQV